MRSGAVNNQGKIYLDACCILHAARCQKLQGSEKDDDAWFLRQILKAGLAGELLIYTCSLSIAECRFVRDVRNEPDYGEQVQLYFTRLFTAGKPMRLIDATPAIARAGRDLLWQHGISGISGADSVHLASALEWGCREFLTTDKKILAKRADFEALDLNIVWP